MTRFILGRRSCGWFSLLMNARTLGVSSRCCSSHTDHVCREEPMTASRRASSRRPYRTVVLDGVLDGPASETTAPDLHEPPRDHDSDGDPAVVGVMIDPGEPRKEALLKQQMTATAGTRSHWVITLEAPEPEPDSMLDDIYCPGRPQHNETPIDSLLNLTSKSFKRH